ncbi:hypothetical protein NKF26_14100 [Haladaptatus sp. AB618]|uniref:hypothetical protein n=1 Tax=Haladaptatus sp. AB618 TaxID=2934173 RepID=UPI00209C0D4B|nr:hypothetical protein [Haladaptatus sp. AB618]MCO8254931.1 hypothetical protein [Haladaptatus sp. AB618]
MTLIDRRFLPLTRGENVFDEVIEAGTAGLLSLEEGNDSTTMSMLQQADDLSFCESV